MNHYNFFYCIFSNNGPLMFPKMFFQRPENTPKKFIRSHPVSWLILIGCYVLMLYELQDAEVTRELKTFSVYALAGQLH